MIPVIDFTRLTTSWTKYDIVRVMEVIHDEETIEKFKRKGAPIDEPILRSFLGINDLREVTPGYWIQIQKFPREKRLFALLATIFTHGGVVKDFADKYSKGEGKGVFLIEDKKQSTNIRSALVESGAASPSYRRSDIVPYDLSLVLQNPEVGKLFKLVLQERISRLTNTALTDEQFIGVCFDNNFHKALSLTKEQFSSWLLGEEVNDPRYIQLVNISNFFSIDEAVLHLSGSKEIYFLGENGDGKSLLLMAIYLAFNGNFIIEKTEQEQTGRASDILRKNTSIKLSGLDDRNTEYNPDKVGYLDNFFAYGTHRGRISFGAPESYGFMTLFGSDYTLLNPVLWLKDQKLLELEKNLDDQNAFGEFKQLPNSFKVSFLEEMFFDLLEKHVQIKFEGSDILFKEKNALLSFDELSEGYKSVLIFVSDLLYRLNRNATEGQDPKTFKGVVMVDEIDLHLHPKWQRVIVKKLRNIFPEVQFIFSTHSPTIIQGASDDAIIYRVYRNADGKTKVSDPVFRKDLDRLMINTVLTSPLFGLEDARFDTDNDNADTSETYLLYRINQKLETVLADQKKAGKVFVSDAQIDDLIQQILDEELSKPNDKNN